MIFDSPTYHVRQFLTYNVRFFGGHFGPPLPTLKSDVINGRSPAQVGETALFIRQKLELRHLVTSEEINRVAEF